MSKRLVAKHDNVIIKYIEEGETMYGNIIIPDIGKERPQMGEVISSGPGRISEFGKFIEPTSEEGDIVLFPKAVGIRIELEGTEYVVLQDKEILANLKDE